VPYKKAVTPYSDLQLELLIDFMDPFRNYGTRSYDEVVDEVRAGRFLLKPAMEGSSTNQPIIMDAVSGKRIKGSGGGLTFGNGQTHWGRKDEIVKAKFAERFMEDFDEAYAALFHSVVVKEDPRAMKIYFEMGLGAPARQMDAGMSTDAFRAALEAIKEARSTTKYIDATTGEYVDAE
jgi:hypothetical protein